MTVSAVAQIALFLIVLLLLVRPLGAYMARVYQGEKTFMSPLVGPVERLIYRITGISADQEMDWKVYALALLSFSAVGLLFLYLLQRLQPFLPLNPQRLGSIGAGLSFNTAASFVTNTDWQSYGGETTMSYLTQMVGLAMQNFISGAAGMAVLIALVRGFSRQSARTVGSFWVDTTRSILYVLLPLSLILAVLLLSQGVVQTLHGSEQVQLLQPVATASGQTVTTQTIAVGPVASQEAIKQLGTNGGGFFQVNSAHPFENPTPLSGFLEMLAILLIPASLCYTYGKMAGDTRKGWALLMAMTAMFVVLLVATVYFEQRGNPALARLGVDQAASQTQAGGNMEGKEVRFGITDSALWTTATTAASNGSVNSMLDSYTPLGGLVPMFLLHLGEVVFGGVGSGLYGMLAFVIIAVFVAGLMIGRTPEYFGKKVEAFEMKMASIMVLMPVLLVLFGTAAAVMFRPGSAAIANPGPHGFSEILYAFSSAAANNGSSFAGLSTNNLFYDIGLGLSFLIGRFWLAIPALAIAGSLAGKRKTPATAGTLPTDDVLFVVWLIAIIVIVGALSFLPALSLGPIVEHLLLR